jgi:hypothetical protein
VNSEFAELRNNALAGKSFIIMPGKKFEARNSNLETNPNDENPNDSNQRFFSNSRNNTSGF